MADNFKSIKRVLMRVDYNVPINNGVISDLTRIQATIPTINFFFKLGQTGCFNVSFRQAKGGKFKIFA